MIRIIGNNCAGGFSCMCGVFMEEVMETRGAAVQYDT